MCQVRPRRYDGLDTIDEDVALSAARPRRHTKPTFRAVESALQDNEWEDEDVPAGRRSRVVRVSEVSETSSAGTKRSASEVTESSSEWDMLRSDGANDFVEPRKSRKVKSESSGPIIQLYEGDYILRRCSYLYNDLSNLEQAPKNGGAGTMNTTRQLSHAAWRVERRRLATRVGFSMCAGSS